MQFAFGMLLVMKKKNLLRLSGDRAAFPCTGQNLGFCDHCPSVGGEGSAWELACAPFLTGVSAEAHGTDLLGSLTATGEFVS